MAVTLPVLPDNVAAALLDLAECVCSELAAAGGEPCWCGLYPGLEVSWEYCGECGNDRCGMGWVRLAGVYPYSIFPTQDFEPNNCVKPLAWQVEVGALRCIPVLPDGHIPDPASLGDVALRQTADAFALYRALQCCSASDIALGTYTPVGPEGGCVGGSWSAFLAFDWIPSLLGPG